MPDDLVDPAVQRPRPPDASEAAASQVTSHCLPLSAVKGGFWALPLQSQTQYVLDGLAGLAADASLLNSGAYAYRARHAELDEPALPYVPKSGWEAARLSLLSRPDRANACGVALLLATVLLATQC